MNDSASAGGEKESLTALLIVLVGFYVYNCATNQESLLWGKRPTPLQSMLALPFRYFSNEQYKDILLPTLICVCYNNEHALQAVNEEMSLEVLVNYINIQIDKEKKELATRQETDDKGLDVVTVKPSSWLLLENRFPRNQWDNAVEYLKKNNS